MEGPSKLCEFLSAQSMPATVSATACSSSQYVSAQDESMVESIWHDSRRMVHERIEESKVHWSVLSENSSSLCKEEVAADNRELFKFLQSQPGWGRFFRTFNEGSNDKLVVGEKFAVGGQAEIFDAYVTWSDPLLQQYFLKKNQKWVLKVFKEGSLLRNLQRQWPQVHKWYTDCFNDTRFMRGNHQVLLSPSSTFINDTLCGTLLDDGEFAFLMWKMEEDLRSSINRKMCGNRQDAGPFSKEESGRFMYQIAHGVHGLHKYDIVHRDLKATNVLIDENRNCRVADYECSIGVVGTGFWRAPEILQACKDKTTSEKPHVFSKAADIYSYAMICYEILTGKHPFQNQRETVTWDSVIGGQQPILPPYIDEWICTLLYRCWGSNPKTRPSIEEVLSTIAANTSSKWVKNVDVM